MYFNYQSKTTPVKKILNQDVATCKAHVSSGISSLVFKVEQFIIFKFSEVKKYTSNLSIEWTLHKIACR